MPAQFAATIQGLKNGVVKSSLKAAIRKIESWEDAVREAGVTGTRALLRDLGALKRQLGREKLDMARVQAIVARIAEAAGKAAARMQGREAVAIRALAKTMSEAVGGSESRSEPRPVQGSASGRAGGSPPLPEEDEYRLSKSAGGSSNMASRYEGQDYAREEYEPRGPSGRVRDPSTTAACEARRRERLYKSRHRGDDGRGEVRDPEHDRRLLPEHRGVRYESEGQEYGGRSRYRTSRFEDEDEDERMRRPSRSRSEGQYEDEGMSRSSRSRSGYEDEQGEPRRSSRPSSRYDEDDDTISGGRGRVRDPEHDMRLKQNRGR